MNSFHRILVVPWPPSPSPTSSHHDTIFSNVADISRWARSRGAAILFRFLDFITVS